MTGAVLLILHFIKNAFFQLVAGITAGAFVYGLSALLLHADTAIMLSETVRKKIHSLSAKTGA